MIRIILFVVAQIALSQLVRWLARDLPSEPINWSLSLAWGSMMILPLVLTAVYWFRTGKPSPLAAVALCCAAWVFGYPSHFDSQWNFVGFFLPSNIAIYAAFALVLYSLDQKWCAYIGGAMAVFGAAMIPVHGLVLTTAEAYVERLIWCVLYALQFIPPTAEAIGRRHDPQKEALTLSRQQSEYKKAA